MHGTTGGSGAGPQLGEPHAVPAQLGVTTYERTAASLITALILVGVCVLLMFFFWLTTRVWVKPQAIEPQLVELSGGGGDRLGDAEELADPSSELDPLDEIKPEELLPAITEIVTEQLVDQQTSNQSESRTPAGEGPGRWAGVGEGPGGTTPRWERWEFRYGDISLQEYARQLDYFKIELAAIGGGRPQVDYAFDLSAAKPRTRTAAEDTRMFLRWTRESATKQADLELLRRAGIPTQGRQILKFIPPEVERQCAVLEQQAVAQRKVTLDQVQKTVFAIIPQGTGYTFHVAQVHLRP